GWIGVSTHNAAQAAAARQSGADQVAFGPIFPTVHKAEPDPVVGLHGLSAVCAIPGSPVVAIGGIDLERAPEVRAAGARWGAVIGALAHATDVVATARALHRALGGQGP